MTTLYPTGYSRQLVTLDRLREIHHPDKMHPEYSRRLFNWIEAQGGHVGIGGSWRDNGTQPDKPGFAPEGRTFHQFQRFASGLVKFAAVDLVTRNGAGVHRAPHWDEVPEQGGADAAKWGVHCNISSETWHMQPIEIDGWASWIGRGSPDPVTGYPIPGDTTSPPEVTPTPTEDRPVRYMLLPPDERPGGPWFLRWDGTWSYLTGRDRDLARAAGIPEFTDIASRYDLVRKSVGV